MLNVLLLWTINDFPACGNLSRCCVKGHLVCLVCGEIHMLHGWNIGEKCLIPVIDDFCLFIIPTENKKSKLLIVYNSLGLSWNHWMDMGFWWRWHHQLFLGKPKKSKQNRIKLESRQNKSKKKEKKIEPVFGKDTSCWTKKCIFFDLVYW